MRRDPVIDALDRWHGAGLIDSAQHRVLRNEAGSAAAERRSGLAGRLLAAAGGIVFVVAFVTLGAIFWDDVDEGVRVVVLWLVAAAVFALGAVGLRARRFERVALPAVAASLGVALGAMTLLEGWLATENDAGLTVGVLATGVFIVVAGLAWARRTPVLPVYSFALLFLWIPFTWWALDVREFDQALWTMDALALAALLAMATWIVVDPDDGPLAGGTRDGVAWVALASSLVLVPWTWYEAVDVGDLDWGVIGTWALLAVVAIGFGLAVRRIGILVVASVVLVVDAWYFGVNKGELFGTFLALLFTAAVLFWVGGRVGALRTGRGMDSRRGGGDPPGAEAVRPIDPRRPVQRR